ncbi:nitrite reductase (NADH) large subunit [Bathymodiolus japonicus methanotrophic gill symbiont]|nr:nitrite reductase (NADH) large subunit [Bathymodiolus japonicus methanotrophic gill symbiont]
MKEKLVLIGNGMAGMRTVDELLKLSPEKFDITVFGAEPHGNYNRIMLSSVLAGDKKIDDIIINDLQWYQDNNISLHIGKTVTKVDRVNQQVVTDDGIKANYDRLIMATGSLPVILDIPGKDLDGVISFRDINDVNVMLETAKTHKKAIVIGGGLLGLEAANGLMIQGMDVSVVHRSNTLMSQQLDQNAAELMRSELEQKGMHFLMNHHTKALLGDQRVEKISFKDGSEIDADLVVMAIGIRPNTKLAEISGIQCDRGILVDDTLQTHTPNIYAAGECVEHRKKTFGLVSPLFEQAKVCANHLADMSISSYISSVTSTKLKVTGIDLFSAGDYIGGQSTEALVFNDPAQHIYKKLVLKDNIIVGIVLYGDTRDGNWFFSLLTESKDISSMRENILFGQYQVEDALEIMS